MEKANQIRQMNFMETYLFNPVTVYTFCKESICIGVKGLLLKKIHPKGVYVIFECILTALNNALSASAKVQSPPCI